MSSDVNYIHYCRLDPQEWKLRSDTGDGFSNSSPVEITPFSHITSKMLAYFFQLVFCNFHFYALHVFHLRITHGFRKTSVKVFACLYFELRVALPKA
jgi:hypothetical protein